jgi:hypothetical protein
VICREFAGADVAAAQAKSNRVRWFQMRPSDPARVDRGGCEHRRMSEAGTAVFPLFTTDEYRIDTIPVVDREN